MDDDGVVLEFGVGGEAGAVGDVAVVGEVDDEVGEFDLTELGVLGWEGVVGDVADDELLLFDVDWPPGAMDMRVRELDELLGEDLPSADGADDVAEFPLVDGAAGVVELVEGAELDEGPELEGAELEGAEVDEDCPPADDDAPPLARKWLTQDCGVSLCHVQD